MPSPKLTEENEAEAAKKLRSPSLNFPSAAVVARISIATIAQIIDKQKHAKDIVKKVFEKDALSTFSTSAIKIRIEPELKVVTCFIKSNTNL